MGEKSNCCDMNRKASRPVVACLYLFFTAHRQMAVVPPFRFCSEHISAPLYALKRVGKRNVFLFIWRTGDKCSVSSSFEYVASSFSLFDHFSFVFIGALVITVIVWTVIKMFIMFIAISSISTTIAIIATTTTNTISATITYMCYNYSDQYFYM